MIRNLMVGIKNGNVTDKKIKGKFGLMSFVGRYGK